MFMYTEYVLTDFLVNVVALQDTSKIKYKLQASQKTKGHLHKTDGGDFYSSMKSIRHCLESLFISLLNFLFCSQNSVEEGFDANFQICRQHHKGKKVEALDVPFFCVRSSQRTQDTSRRTAQSGNTSTHQCQHAETNQVIPVHISVDMLKHTR